MQKFNQVFSIFCGRRPLAFSAQQWSKAGKVPATRRRMGSCTTKVLALEYCKKRERHLKLSASLRHFPSPLGRCPVMSAAKHQRGSRHRAFLASVVGRPQFLGTHSGGRSPRPRYPGGVHTHVPNLRNVTATPQCPGVFIVVLIGPCGSRFW